MPQQFLGILKFRGAGAGYSDWTTLPLHDVFDGNLDSGGFASCSGTHFDSWYCVSCAVAILPMSSRLSCGLFTMVEHPTGAILLVIMAIF